MTNLEQKIPDALLWKMYDAMAPINPYETRARVEAAAKIALELAHDAFYAGRKAGAYADHPHYDYKTFKQFIQDYE